MKKFLTLFTALLFFGSMMVVQAADYYVAGSMNEWNTTSNENKMSLVSGNLYSKTFSAMGATSYEFKISTYNWGSSWGGGNIDGSQGNVTLGGSGNITFTLSTASDVTFYFDAGSTKKIYVQATPVDVPSYTFTNGTTIYYDFTAYDGGVNVCINGSEPWHENTSVIFSETLSSAWEVTATTNLFKSAPNDWTYKTCSTLPTEGQNMLVGDADGIGCHWDTYSPAAPSVSFNGVPSEVFVGQQVTFAASSENVTNPTYTYQIKIGEGEYAAAANPYTFNAAGSYTVKVEVRENGEGDALALAEKSITCVKYSLMQNDHAYNNKGSEAAVCSTTNGTTFTATWDCPSAGTYYFYVTKNTAVSTDPENANCDYLCSDQELTDGVAKTAYLYGAHTNYDHSYTLNAPRAGEYTFTLSIGESNTFKCDFPVALTAEVDLNALPIIAFKDANLTFATYAASVNVTNPEYTFFVKQGDGEYGSAVANYTFAQTGAYTVKVEVREEGAGGDALATAEKNITIYEPQTFYFVNKEGWSELAAYAYADGDIKNAVWPGETMSATGEETEEHNYAVYSITLPKDRYATIIFNNNGAGSQTGNMTIDNTKPYYFDGAWYATLAQCDAAPVTYHLYVRNLTTWDEFDVFAWGDKDYFGAWGGKTAPDNTTTIDGITYNIYDFEAVAGSTINMNLIFHNGVTDSEDPNYHRHTHDATEARDYYFTVSNDGIWEGLSGVKRFRACLPLEHVFGYQFDEYGTVGTEWPGAELTPDAEGWYEFVVTKGRTVIFNNGTGEGAMQTGDLAYTDGDPVADEVAVWQGATNVAGEPAKTYMVTSDDPDAICTTTYERIVTNGNYGTICLPYEAVSVTGATLFSIAGKNDNGIFIDEETTLLKGVPYIFLASADRIVVRYWEGQDFTPSGNNLYSHNGLVGYINDGEEYTVTPDAHNFILYNNGLWWVNSVVKLASNRAFIDWSQVPDHTPAPAPGRKRCAIGVHNMPTAIDQTTNDQPMTNKVILNGHLYIINNGVMYNAQGIIVK